MSKAIDSGLSDGLNFKKLVLGAASSMSVKIGGLGVVFFLHLVLARLLTFSEYGAYAFYLSFSIITSIAGRLTLDTTVIRLVAEQVDDKQRFKGVLIFTTVLTLTFCCSAAVLVFLLKELLPYDGILWHHSIALSFFMSITTVAQGVLRVLGYNVVAFAPDLLIRSSFALIGTVGVAYFSVLTLESAFIVHVFASLFAAGLSMLMVYRSLPTGWWLVNAEFLGVQWIKVVLTVFWGSFLVLAEPQLAVLLSSWLLSPEETALVSVASRVAVIVGIFMVAVTMFVTPKVTKVFMTKSSAHLESLVRKSAWVMFLPTVPLALLVFFFGYEVLALFGSEYENAFSLLVVFAVGNSLSASFGPVGILMGLCREKIYARIATLSIVFLVVMSVVLTPLYGTFGIAMAVVCTLVSRRCVCWIIIKRYLGISSAIV